MGLTMDDLGRFRSRQNFSNNTAPYPPATVQSSSLMWHHVVMVVSWSQSSVITYVNGSAAKNFNFDSSLTSMEMGESYWVLGSSNIVEFPCPSDAVMDNVSFIIEHCHQRFLIYTAMSHLHK